MSYYKARRGKQRKSSVADFTLNLESELLTLQQQLTDGSYQPGEYRLFTIYERKPRTIAAAPFRDRVLHHALLNVVEPLLDKRFISDSYACRQGKGVHQAVDRYQIWANRYRYALKMDIWQYFPSIDHLLLKDTLRHRLKDKSVLALFDQLIDTAPPVKRPPIWYAGDDLFTPGERRTGIPIGNLTSQFLANLYLDDFDHFLKEQYRLPAYLRYVDDFVVLGDDKHQLHDLREIIRDYLATYRLRLHPHKAHIVPTRQGLNLLGYFVQPHHRYLRNDNGHRFARKLRHFAKHYATGRMTWQDFNPSVQSWIGHAKHVDTLGLRHRIFSATVFRKGICQ